MADCDWVILCDYAFHDIGRKMCLIGIFDKIFVPSVPATHHQAALAVRLVGEPKEKVSFKVEITRPPEAGGGTVANLGGEVELAEAGTGEIQFNMGGLPLPDYGLYAFNVYLGDQLAKTAGFTVARPAQQPPLR